MTPPPDKGTHPVVRGRLYFSERNLRDAVAAGKSMTLAELDVILGRLVRTRSSLAVSKADREEALRLLDDASPFVGTFSLSVEHEREWKKQVASLSPHDRFGEGCRAESQVLKAADELQAALSSTAEAEGNDG